MTRLGKHQLNHHDHSKTAIFSAGTDTALCYNKATMSENASLDTMDGSGIMDCVSEANDSRLHKQDLRNPCGVQEDLRVY